MSQLALQVRMGIGVESANQANDLVAKLPRRLELDQRPRNLGRRLVVPALKVDRTLGRAHRKEKNRRPPG